MWYETKEKLAINGVIFNFLPSWWNANYGFTFGRRFVFDPDYRTSQILKAERLIAARFPDLHIGDPEALPRVTAPDFGNASTPAAAGCEIHYPDTNYPWNKHLDFHGTVNLKAPGRITNVFPYDEIIRQVGYLNRALGRDEKPVLPIRGVLNDAALLAGLPFFENILIDPASTADLLDYTFTILTSALTENVNTFKFSGMVMICNCTVMMVSPQFYAQRLLAYDLEIQRLTKQCGCKFGIHHCGIFDKYCSAYRTVPHVDWLGIGWDSDLDLALSTFPEAIVQYLVSPTFLLTASCSQVHDRIASLMHTASSRCNRLRFEVSDIEFNTPEENIRAVYNCIADSSSRSSAI